MTTKAQISANQRNATASTGPRTVEGKARSSQNTRRHGVTAKPTRSRVAVWFRVILNDPHVDPSAFLSGDRTVELALRLAEAEARLATARDALEQHQAAPEPDSDDSALCDELDLKGSRAKIQQRLDSYLCKRLASPEGLSAEEFRRVSRLREAAPLEDPAVRKRLLIHYGQAAQNRRDQAFRAWIEHRAMHRQQALAESA